MNSEMKLKGPIIKYVEFIIDTEPVPHIEPVYYVTTFTAEGPEKTEARIKLEEPITYEPCTEEIIIDTEPVIDSEPVFYVKTFATEVPEKMDTEIQLEESIIKCEPGTEEVIIDSEPIADTEPIADSEPIYYQTSCTPEVAEKVDSEIKLEEPVIECEPCTEELIVESEPVYYLTNSTAEVPEKMDSEIKLEESIIKSEPFTEEFIIDSEAVAEVPEKMDTEVKFEEPNIKIEPFTEELIIDSEPVADSEPSDNLRKPTAEVPERKRRLDRTTVQFKKEIVEKYESGVGVNQLSAEYNMPRSTISTILKQREIIKAADVAKGEKWVTKQRPQILEEVEKLLLIWANKKRLDGIPIYESAICEKAKKLFEDLLKTKPEISSGVIFKASRGWYENFKRRSGICKPNETASDTRKSADKFASDFKDFINSEKFYPQQVFSCNETSLFWRKLPRKTFLAKEEMATPGHKPMNDRVTLLLCSNASGDLKLKPLLVHHSENTRVFLKNHVMKTQLPVLWRSHPKRWITKQLFIEWMNEVFCPTVKAYLTEKKLPLKVLFLLDNAPRHSVDLDDSLRDDFNFITVRFMPSDATPLVRPMDENVLVSFKKLYIKVLLQRCFSETSNTELTLRDFWKKHLNIFHGIQVIQKAWDEVSTCRLNSSWQKIWPECVFNTEYDVFETESYKTMEEILTLSQKLGLEMRAEDVEKLVVNVEKELTTEELEELLKEQDKQIPVEITAGSQEVEEEFPVALIREMLDKWTTVQNCLEKYHPDPESTRKILRLMNDRVLAYFRRIVFPRKKNKKRIS